MFQNPMSNWQENLSWEDILKLESQGVDVAEIKEKFLIQQEKDLKEQEKLEKLRFSNEDVSENEIPNPTNLTLLNKFFSGDGLDINSHADFIKKTIGKKPFLFGKSKWENSIKIAKPLYASVVQCDPQLWKNATSVNIGAVLLVFSAHPEHRTDISLIKKVSKRLKDFAKEEDVSSYSKKMQKLHDEMDNPNSSPGVKLDNTLLDSIGVSEDLDLHVRVNFFYSGEKLPGKKLPSDGILPYVIIDEDFSNEKYGMGATVRDIPAEFYVN